MEDLILDLRCTDGKEEVLLLMEKTTKIIHQSSGDVKSIRFSNSSSVQNLEDDVTDDQEFLTYVANSFVTILLYYYEVDFDIFKSASSVLLSLLSKFPTLQPILGHSGLYDNLARFINQQFTLKNISSDEIGHCCMQLLSAITFDCSSNIDKCVDVDLFHIVEQYLRGKFTSVEHYIVGLKLLSFLISDFAESDTKEADQNSAYISKIWRQQCLVHETRRHSSVFGVVAENQTVLARILQLMNSFLIDSAAIQVFGLKCLNILVTTDGACEDLWTEGAFDTTLHACYHYITSEQIQRHGFSLLKQLLFKSLCNEKLSKLISLSDTLFSKYDMLERVLVGSLTSYSHCGDILIPVCDVIKGLIFTSEHLAISMIAGGIPKTIYDIYVEMNTTTISNVEHLRNDLLSCFSLFCANYKICKLTADSFLTCDHHYPAALICMMLFGANIHDMDCDNQTLLMKACARSQFCVVNSMLNIEHIFVLHGIRKLNLEGVKCCIRYFHTGVRCSISVIALLLRFLIENDDVSSIDLKDLGLRDLNSHMLDLIFNSNIENGRFFNHKTSENNLKDGIKLAQDVLHSKWEPENFDRGLGDVLQNKYMQEVNILGKSSANTLTLEQCNGATYALYCQCAMDTVSDRNGKKIEFEEHLHISFDNVDSPCNKTQHQDTSLPTSNAYCEKCASLFKEDSGFGKFAELECDVPDVAASVQSTMDITHNSFHSLAFLGRSPELRHIVQNLSNFFCGHNPIAAVSCEIAELLCNVKEMQLDNANLKQFPVNILLHCKHLVALDVSHNDIEDFSTDFSIEEDLHRNLSTLKMSHNNLNCFPFFICSMLKGLSILDLSNNSIKDVAESNVSGEILVSESINLSSNEIKEIRLSFLNQLSKTKQLDFSKNQITDIFEDVQLASSPVLHRINFSHNNMENFAAILLQLKLLKVLNLSNNCISSLPSKFTPTAQLRELDLSDNKIIEIGEFLKSVSGAWMHSLKMLKLAHNQVEEAPSEIGLLKNLEVLDLRNNSLVQVTNQLGRLSKLYQLSLAGNLLDIDQKLIEGKTQELRSYFYSRLKSSEERLKANILLFSSSIAWTTAFLNLLKSKHKMQEAKIQHDCGITVYEWSLETGKRTFSIMLYEINLEEKSFFQCYPQIAMIDCALYIVISEAQSSTDMSVPLYAIQEFAPSCPVIHVNVISEQSELKMDPPLFGLPSRVQQLNFECCLPEASHEQELTNCLSSILNEYKFKGNSMFVSPVPKNYLTLEKIFAEAKEKLCAFPVVSYSSLIDLIQQHERLQLNLEDGEELLAAIHYLTKFGVIWHQEDSRNNMRNYFILDPLWLLDIFKKVFITVEEEMKETRAEKEKYLVSKKQLKEVVEIIFSDTTREEFEEKNDVGKANSASKSFIPVLLRFMLNRSLIFDIDDDTYFIPYLLEYFNPELFHDEDKYKKNHLIRLLHMDFMPVNFWHHLISAIFNICKRMDGNLSPVCWKNGVAVMKGSCVVFSIKQIFPANEHTWLTRTSLKTQGKSFVQVCVYNEDKQILPLLMDHLNNTIEEWASDLLEYDICGQQYVIQYIPCIDCVIDDSIGNVHLFVLEDLLKILDENVGSMFCPNHTDIRKHLDENIPDVMLQDFKLDHLLDSSLLKYKTEQEDLLGEGGFGTVFRGKYAGQDVAIKSLRSGSSTPAFINLRNEMNILGKLPHPSIISLVGYLLQYNEQPVTLLVMELAQEGALSNYLTSLHKLSATEALTKFPRFMRLRVALQVLEGVAFMHKHSFIYRDLKPDNVLVMTLDQNKPYNVKLVDFGITVSSIPSGTVGGCGSPGYSSPEVVSLKLKKKDGLWNRIPYTDKCDVFSFGILSYEIAVCRTPWFIHSNGVSEATMLPNAPDEAVMKGVLPSSLTSFDINLRWPHMQDIISSCLKRNPDDRPSVEQLLQLMKKPEICCFRNHIDLGNVETGGQLFSVLTVNNVTDNAKKDTKIQVYFMCLKKKNAPSSTKDDCTQQKLPSKKNAQTQTSIKMIKVLADSIQVLDQASYEVENIVEDISAISCVPQLQLENISQENILIIGTQKGKLFQVSLKSKKTILFCDLRTGIGCLHFHKLVNNSFQRYSLMYVGLENGYLAVFKLDQIYSWKTCKPLHMMNLCQYYTSSPVISFTSDKDGVYACCSKHIAHISVEGKNLPKVLQLKMLPRASVKIFSLCLQHIAICHGNIFASYHSSRQLLCWKEISIFPVVDVNVLSFSDKSDQIRHTTSSITSLLSDEHRNVLYVGLNTGHIMILECNHDQRNSNSELLKIITIIQRHTGPVWNLSLAENRSQEQDMVMAFGSGFRSTSEDCIVRNSKVRSHSPSSTTDDARMSTCVAFFDANLPEIDQDMRKIGRQRDIVKF